MNSESPGFLKNRVAQKLIIGHIMETVADARKAIMTSLLSQPDPAFLIVILEAIGSAMKNDITKHTGTIIFISSSAFLTPCHVSPPAEHSLIIALHCKDHENDHQQAEYSFLKNCSRHKTSSRNIKKRVSRLDLHPLEHSPPMSLALKNTQNQDFMYIKTFSI